LDNLERSAEHILSAAGGGVPALAERRAAGPDRRRVTLRSFLRGGFTPRRRGGRRAGETVLVDWHEPHLLFLALVILLLSVADAFLTLILLSHGATEANPVMAFVLERHPELFAAVKMLFTGMGVLVMVAVARARVFSVRVATVLHWLLVAYAALIFYEWSLLEYALVN
jgi:hypothetical protein